MPNLIRPTEAAQVEAVNRLSESALDLFDAIQHALRPFIGKKTIKADGSPVAQLEKLLPKCPGAQWYWQARPDSLIRIKNVTRYQVGEFTKYQETAFLVGELEGDRLKTLTSPESIRHLKTDWTLQEIETTKQRIKTLETELEQLRSTLGPFQQGS